MTKTTKQYLNVRISDDDVARLDRLMATMATATGLELNRSDVHRAALARGLSALEEEHGLPERRKGRG